MKLLSNICVWRGTPFLKVKLKYKKVVIFFQIHFMCNAIPIKILKGGILVHCWLQHEIAKQDSLAIGKRKLKNSFIV